MTADELLFLRAVKGAPLSVLTALLFARRSMTALELQERTAYSPHSVALALRVLVALGWVRAVAPNGPWRLARK